MKKRSMKKLLAFTSVLMLFLCCFSSAAVADSRRDAPVSVSFDFPAEQIIVHDPEESLGYDAADEYCLAHSSEVTIRFSLPAAADPARSFVQIAYDFYEPHYFTDMPTENGCYVFTSNHKQHRHNGHNGLPLQRSSDLYQSGLRSRRTMAESPCEYLCR